MRSFTISKVSAASAAIASKTRAATALGPGLERRYPRQIPARVHHRVRALSVQSHPRLAIQQVLFQSKGDGGRGRHRVRNENSEEVTVIDSGGVKHVLKI